MSFRFVVRALVILSTRALAVVVSEAELGSVACRCMSVVIGFLVRRGRGAQLDGFQPS